MDVYLPLACYTAQEMRETRIIGSSWFLVSRSEIPVPGLLLPSSPSTIKHRTRVVAAGEQSPHDHT